MPEEKDSAQEKLKTLDVKPGDIFRHYKGDDYEVVTLAVKEDTLEPLVIYKSLLKGYVWARALTNWNESVEVEGNQIPRFQKLD